MKQTDATLTIKLQQIATKKTLTTTTQSSPETKCPLQKCSQVLFYQHEFFAFEWEFLNSNGHLVSLTWHESVKNNWSIGIVVFHKELKMFISYLEANFLFKKKKKLQAKTWLLSYNMLKINELFSIMSILGFCAEALAENYGICEAFSCNITKYAFNYMCWGFELQPGRPIGEVSAWGSLVYQVRTLNVCWGFELPHNQGGQSGRFRLW